MTLEADTPPTWGAQLAHAERILAASGAPAPHDEALTLLGSLLGAPATLLRARPDSHMSAKDVETYTRWVSRRAAGEAIAHITGRLAFMGLELTVSPESPLPSPGASRLVEIALEWTRRRPPGDLLVAEIGAGCGAISLALASFEPRLTRIYAVESSATALEAAAENGARYLLNLVISWLAGDGLAAIPEPVDVIVCGQRGFSDLVGGRLEEAPLSSPVSPMTEFLKHASAKLRPGGTLLCAIADERRDAASQALARAFPQARVWVDAPSGASAIVIVQLPEYSLGAGDSGGAGA